jgi:hypothetical protein
MIEMSDKREYTINDAGQLRALWPTIRDMILSALRGGPVVITLGRQKRNLNQNACLWAHLSDIASQCQLCINGQMVKASPDDWKQVFSAALHQETRMAAGVNGGVVMLGRSTSKMDKAEFGDLLTLVVEYGDSANVKWLDPTLAHYENYREAQFK